MTAAQKKEIAHFLDLSFDALHGGYRTGKRNYNFTDDVQQDGAEPEDAAVHSDTLERIADEIQKCTACPLCKNRKNTAPGSGSSRPLVMVIGNPPGAGENAAGRPFSGISGERLAKMLAPIGLSPDTNCFVTGIVKCPVPDEEYREPNPAETTACAAFLHRQILLLKPRCILCTGSIAARSLLRTTGDIETLRNKDTKIRVGDMVIPVAVTYHPDDIWKNEELKRPAWEDLKKLKIKLEEMKILNKGTSKNFNF